MMTRILTLEQAITFRAELRAAAQPLVFTNGHFDLLHVGHLDYLEKARALGAGLLVGINGDSSTRRLKGEGRPLVPAVERARLIAALRPVTAVLIFEEDTAVLPIQALEPEVYVKGGDYAVSDTKHAKPLPERAAVEAYGGQIVFMDYRAGHSTTELIRRIKELP